jgi:hypothetical protein
MNNLRRLPCEYDEEAILLDHVFHYGRDLMTDLERRTDSAIHYRTKADSWERFNKPQLAREMRERGGRIGDSEVEAALAEGYEAFRIRFARRILSEHPSFVNRCPRCRKVVRTPKARQ